MNSGYLRNTLRIVLFLPVLCAGSSPSFAGPLQLSLRLPIPPPQMQPDTLSTYGTAQTLEFQVAPAQPPRAKARRLLVVPQRVATLRLTSGNARIIAKVRPLKAAAGGETVPVRVLGTARILLGHVVGTDSLEGSF